MLLLLLLLWWTWHHRQCNRSLGSRVLFHVGRNWADQGRACYVSVVLRLRVKCNNFCFCNHLPCIPEGRGLKQIWRSEITATVSFLPVVFYCLVSLLLYASQTTTKWIKLSFVFLFTLEYSSLLKQIYKIAHKVRRWVCNFGGRWMHLILILLIKDISGPLDWRDRKSVV